VCFAIGPVRELGVAGVAYAVKKGKKIVKDNGFKMIG